MCETCGCGNTGKEKTGIPGKKNKQDHDHDHSYTHEHDSYGPHTHYYDDKKGKEGSTIIPGSR